MRGYNSNPNPHGAPKSTRDSAYGKTYFSMPSFELESPVTLHIHRTDAARLGIGHKEMWALVPWSPWQNVTEEERQAHEGTIAFVKADYVTGFGKIPTVALSTTGSGRWTKTLKREWIERYLLRDKRAECADASGGYKRVHIIPEVRIHTEGNEVALILGPELNLVVQSGVYWGSVDTPGVIESKVVVAVDPADPSGEEKDNDGHPRSLGVENEEPHVQVDLGAVVDTPDAVESALITSEGS